MRQPKLTRRDRDFIEVFKEYRKNLKENISVELSDPFAIAKHRAELEKNDAEWCKFFFPKFASADFAKFQTDFLKRIQANTEWYEVLSWSRELAKTTICMFGVLKLILSGRKKNVILASNSYDNAERLLEPYRAQLDSNPRIIAYYGKQEKVGSWESGEFSTIDGVSFRALGAGQSPRGTRNNEVRPDIILVDDFDTDEDCRNPQIVENKWRWFEQALYPTRSVSKPLLVIFCGNIIAKDCCITRAGALADNWDIINIRDKNGKSSWNKNSEEHINRVLSKISMRSAEQEYFNNPIASGDTFPEVRWGKCPLLRKLDFAVVYADPSTSNKDRQKGNRARSFKAMFLLGCLNGTYYIYTGFLDQTTNFKFVEWFYALRDFVGDKTRLHFYCENNSLQDPFFEQVLEPIISELNSALGPISVHKDKRNKPDKYVRIEGTLEPLNRTGKLVFNINEKDNPNMQRLEEQFLLVNPMMNAPADGPDCIEGGISIINQLVKTLAFEPQAFFRKHRDLC